jgi:prepilin-type N-terminal cleavage/methylation domain-containing protein
MNVMRRSVSCAPGRQRAFSLIEMIGVLAVIAILAAAIFPVLLRQLDYAAQGNEGTNLAAVASGLQQGAMGRRYVPSANDWAGFIATNIGWRVSGVQTNTRNNPRIFLIDPTLVIGTNTAANLPYQQTTRGSTNLPTNPRFIIMTSLSSALPTGLNSGIPLSADFNALWSNPDDTIPTGTSWSWSNFKQGADIRIQRINLAPSFCHLVLSVSDPTNALYSIDNSVISTVTNGPTGGLDTYLLSSTILKLYARTGTSSVTNLVASQVLQQDTSWVLSGGIWRNANVPAPAGGGGGSWGTLIDTFLNSPSHNGISTSRLFTDMTNWLAGYNQFAAGGFTNTALKTSLGSGGSLGGVLYGDYKTMDAN